MPVLQSGTPICDNFARIDETYIKSGKVEYVFVDLPLESMHGNELKAAEAAHVQMSRVNSRQMHDGLFADQSKLGRGFAGYVGRGSRVGSGEVSNVCVVTRVSMRTVPDP